MCPDYGPSLFGDDSLPGLPNKIDISADKDTRSDHANQEGHCRAWHIRGGPSAGGQISNGSEVSEDTDIQGIPLWQVFLHVKGSRQGSSGCVGRGRCFARIPLVGFAGVEPSLNDMAVCRTNRRRAIGLFGETCSSELSVPIEAMHCHYANIKSDSSLFGLCFCGTRTSVHRLWIASCRQVNAAVAQGLLHTMSPDRYSRPLNPTAIYFAELK